MPEEKKEKAGGLGLIFSFLIPILGVIIYFINKDEVENAAAYLLAALGGIIFALILMG